MKLILFFNLLFLINQINAQTSELSDIPISKSVSSNSFLFISGQTGSDSKGNLKNASFSAEFTQAMKNVSSILKSKGLEITNLVNVTIYLKNMSNYDTLNHIYKTFFKGAYPSRTCISVADLPSHANIEISAIAKSSELPSMTENTTQLNKEVVTHFLNEVRTGKSPENTHYYMADTVLAHQVNAEKENFVKRSPENYTQHVYEFKRLYGDYQFQVTELIAENDRVYVRWKQTGKHLVDFDNYPATGKPLIEIASVVYRLEKGKIVEYWIQIDRMGLEKQLEMNKKL